MKFKANRIGTDREYAVVVAFAEETDTGDFNESIIFQRSLPQDDDGAGICTIKGNQEKVVYNGIDSFSIDTEKCICRYSEKTSDELDISGEIEISFELQKNQVADLKEAINYIFQGHPNFSESI